MICNNNVCRSSSPGSSIVRGAEGPASQGRPSPRQYTSNCIQGELKKSVKVEGD